MTLICWSVCDCLLSVIAENVDALITSVFTPQEVEEVRKKVIETTNDDEIEEMLNQLFHLQVNTTMPTMGDVTMV